MPRRPRHATQSWGKHCAKRRFLWPPHGSQVASTCAMVALFMLLIFVVAPNAQFQGPFTCEEPCRDWSRASSPQDLYVCLDMYTKRCAAPSRNRCYNGEVHCRQKGASSDCPQSCSSFAGFASKWDQYVCFNNATAVCTEATNTGCMSAELRCRPMP
ncbi:unnamed protein product [Durusdinium trenchii]|uniref:Uncharacterized protein n=1 Tax=Durusdinium trenchii TaxID=1381693 RepID=A0ABP0LZ22_9DINO